MLMRDVLETLLLIAAYKSFHDRLLASGAVLDSAGLKVKSWIRRAVNSLDV